MKILGWDLYWEKWDNTKALWDYREWQLAREDLPNGDILIWFGPWHLALCKL